MSTDDTPDWPSLYDPSLDLLHIPHNDPVQPRGHYLTHAQDVFSFTLYWTLIFYLPLFVFAGLFAFLNIIFPPNSSYRRRINEHPSKSAYLDNDSFTRNEGEDSAEMYPLAPLTATSVLSAMTPTPTTAATSTGYYTASPSSPRGSRAAYTALVPKPGADDAAPGHPASISTTPFPEQRPSISASVPTSSVAPASAAHRAAAKTQCRTPQNLQVNPHRTRVVYALLVLFVFLFSGLLGAVVGSAVVGYVLAGLYQAGGFHMSTWIPPLFALVQTLIGVLGIYPSVAEII